MIYTFHGPLPGFYVKCLGHGLSYYLRDVFDDWHAAMAAGEEWVERLTNTLGYRDPRTAYKVIGVP